MWGHRVALLTRPSSRRALAESITPSGIHLLERVGAHDEVLGTGFVRSTGNTVWWGGDPERDEAFPAGTFGLQVHRSAFDRVLLAAAARAGVSLREGASVREARTASHGERVVQFELSGAVQEERARWVLDCSGRGGLLSRDVRVTDVAARTTALVGIWECAEGWAVPDWTRTTVESSPTGWVWSIPVSASRRYVTAMVDPAVSGLRGVALPQAYGRALESCPRHLAMVGAAALAESPFAVDATPYHATRVSEDGVLLVGDAASFVDPLASFGIKKAMAAAWLAAVVAHTALTEPSMGAPARDLFERWEAESHAALWRGVHEYATLADSVKDRSGDSGASSTDQAYWGHRSERRPTELDVGLDAKVLRTDHEVVAALNALRTREHLHVRISPSCTIASQPTVQGNRVVLTEHFTTPRLAAGVRYLRNIDLLYLARIAVEQNRVPDVIEAYNRGRAVAPLADLLGALSVLVAKGVLEFA